MAGKSTLNRLELSQCETPTPLPHDQPRGGGDRELCWSISSSRRIAKRLSRSSSTSTPPTTRCMAIRKAVFFTGYYDCYCYLPLLMCSAAAISWRRSSRKADIDATRARWRRSRVSSRRSARAGRNVRILVQRRLRVRARSIDGLVRDRTGSIICSAWRATPASQAMISERVRRRPRARRRRAASRRAASRSFRWSTLHSSSRERRVVAEAESTQGRGRPAFIVASLSEEAHAFVASTRKPIARAATRRTGIKECQLDLFADRTSAATCAPISWSAFAAFAYVLLCALRRIA